MMTLFERDKARYGPIFELRQNILRGPSPFSVGERELIAAFVSSLNQCQFCLPAHTQHATKGGFDVAVLPGLVANIDTAAISDRLRPIFRFVKKLTEQPARIVQADADAVFAAGWNEAALGDAIAVCAFFNMVNRIADGHGLKATRPERLGATKTDAS
jgi:uncharacterized peroxidase-related enzyme